MEREEEEFIFFKRNSLVVLWLGLWALKAKGVSLIPDYGTMIPQAAPPEEKKEEREIHTYIHTCIYMYILLQSTQ